MAIAAAPSPNSREAIVGRVQGHSVGWASPLAMLGFRTLAFAVFQALIAAVFATQGEPDAWARSIAWWPVSAILANLATAGALAVLCRREGIGLRDLYRTGPHRFKQEILIMLGFTLLAGPVALLPNVLLGSVLYGDVAIPGALFLQSLPQGVVLLVFILFPLTQSLVELPTYFSYSMPRLVSLAARAWPMVVLASLGLAVQHAALPLVFDLRFIIWRVGMFLPFALLVGFLLYKKPSLLPYLLVVHFLMDMQTMSMLLPIATP